ncbi:sensor histidine kinase [Pararhodospirillum oryzae]|uniref:histidine kinase n=1 Tax=Pararhodospirillum oryzae TaxID=478448 RepID=A0A512H3H4_9PROT|nr:sensor histidine kinase [Pararhodospirillum oryzae]GEO80012.1 histidine kinase [Pararhodospirillum oryzae]
MKKGGARRTWSLRARLLGGGALWLLAAVGTTHVLLGWAIDETLERTFQDRLVVDLESLIAATDTRDGHLVMTRDLSNPLFERPFSGWYWQVAHGETLLRSRSLWDETLNAQTPVPAGALHVHQENGPGGRLVQVVERDILLPDLAEPVHVMIAAERETVEQDSRHLRTLVALCLGGLALGLLGAVTLQVAFGLRPVRRLGADLDALRARPEARLSPDQPGELAPLARALNAVLDHDADLIARARAHVGALAHGLKTPLAILTAAAGEGPTVPAATVQAETRTMTRLVERYLARARAETGSGSARGVRVAVLDAARRLQAPLAALHRRDLDVTVEGDESAFFAGDPDDLMEILGNLMDNACKWANTRVRVRAAWAGEAGDLVLVVEDDGPGLADHDHARALTRGARLDDTVPGHGLGLAIVHDLVALHAGTLDLGRSPLGGLAVTLRFPPPGVSRARGTA